MGALVPSAVPHRRYVRLKPLRSAAAASLVGHPTELQQSRNFGEGEGRERRPKSWPQSNRSRYIHTGGNMMFGRTAALGRRLYYCCIHTSLTRLRYKWYSVIVRERAALFLLVLVTGVLLRCFQQLCRVWKVVGTLPATECGWRQVGNGRSCPRTTSRTTSEGGGLREPRSFTTRQQCT